jgi:hypothetical protein
MVFPHLHARELLRGLLAPQAPCKEAREDEGGAEEGDP